MSLSGCPSTLSMIDPQSLQNSSTSDWPRLTVRFRSWVIGLLVGCWLIESVAPRQQQDDEGEKRDGGNDVGGQAVVPPKITPCTRRCRSVEWGATPGVRAALGEAIRGCRSTGLAASR